MTRYLNQSAHAGRKERRGSKMSAAKKIFCFVNSGKGTDCQAVMALCADGVFLASHISSSEGFARHDIGITSDWKHDTYKKHCPEGFDLEWVDDPLNHPELMAAYELNQKLGKEAKAKEKENGDFAGVSIEVSE